MPVNDDVNKLDWFDEWTHRVKLNEGYIRSTEMDSLTNTIRIDYEMPLDTVELVTNHNIDPIEIIKTAYEHYRRPYYKIYIEDFIDHIYANAEKGVIVVKWTDGETTKVTLDEDDNWDLEAGVSAAIIKRMYKSHTNFKNFITNNITYNSSKKEK